MKKLLFIPLMLCCLFCSGQIVRIDADTSGWRLYKIDNNSYSYFRLISYGTMDKKTGWSDAMAYYQQDTISSKILFKGSKVTDTIPTVMHISGYDEKKKMFKEWDEYRVGGMLGRFAYYGNVIWKKE